MTLDEFVARYKGTKVDFDGNFGPQCVDLYRQYCKDVLDIPQTPPVVGAKDLFDKRSPVLFYIRKEDIFKYAPGDICIWGATKMNEYGHVAILLSAEDNKLTVFEQDGFKQDGAKESTRAIDNLIGIIRRM